LFSTGVVTLAFKSWRLLGEFWLDYYGPFDRLDDSDDVFTPYGQQLGTFFIKTDPWMLWIIGLLVKLEDMLHLLQELRRDFRNTATLYLPGVLA